MITLCDFVVFRVIQGHTNTIIWNFAISDEIFHVLDFILTEKCSVLYYNTVNIVTQITLIVRLLTASIIFWFIRPRYIQPSKYGQVIGNTVGKIRIRVSGLVTYRPNIQLSEEGKSIHAKLKKIFNYYINNGCKSPHNCFVYDLDRFE